MQKTANCSPFFQKAALLDVSDQLTSTSSLSAPITKLPRLQTQMLRIMRLLIIFLFAAFMNVYASGSGQSITLAAKGMPLKQVFAAIEKQTGYFVFYNADALNVNNTLTFAVKDMPLQQFLQLLLRNLPFTYQIEEKTISLEEKHVARPPASLAIEAAVANPAVAGRVVDSLGMSLQGVSVKLTPGNKGTTSGPEGLFRIENVPPGNYIVELSLIGHQTVFRKITVSHPVLQHIGSITLFVSNVELEAVDIVSTGMFDRNKATFTGVTRKITGKELREASRANILEGLNMLDPSFKIIRDNNFGSDPNQLPKVEMRGNRSMPPPTPEKYSQQLKLEYEQDPNQPLFILDGFETNLATIVQLDVNRIASITLLKDAASTALYGSQSANGVVVVETIKPAPGALSVSYAVTGSLVMPDLGGYNMMNGWELLKFQELASVGEGALGPFVESSNNLLVPKLKHDFRENALRSGVHSNWMKVPLRTVGTLNHSLSINGGDEYFNYNVGLSTTNNDGVMKASTNRNTGAHSYLSYRKNKINIANNLTLNWQAQNGSPFGSFSQFVNVPPYYAINGKTRYLEEHRAVYTASAGYPADNEYNFPNPLYNAYLPYKNKTAANVISNNLMAYWDILPYLRVSTGVQYASENRQGDYFISPLNTQFDNVEASKKGSYDFSSSKKEQLNGSFTVTFNRVYAAKHIVNMNLRGQTRQTTEEAQYITAVGYATTAEPLLYLANSYKQDGSPDGASIKTRSTAIIGSVNYSYDLKYNLDLSYNQSGTSKFGSDNPFQTFYSFGIGWNIGKENFLKDATWVNNLSITANYGLTGNENAGRFGSRSTYKLQNEPTVFGESLQLSGVGNPNLEWTKTYSLSYGISGLFFNNVLSMSLHGYRNITDPMIINLPLPGSMGMKSIPKNIGKLTSNGLELLLDAKIVNTRNWTLNAALNTPLIYKSEYSGLGNALEKFNDSARNGNYLQRYYDGGSPDDVWAIRSLGVGQSKGYEILLDKNGAYTYLFDVNNEVAIGTSRPVTQGNLNIRIRYKRLTMAIMSRYVVEEMKLNTVLYDKVENITQTGLEFNQDKRALYVRWQNPGDDASFIGVASNSLGISSRFLQKENAFFVDGINFNYDLLSNYDKRENSYLKRKMGVQAITLGMNSFQLFQFRFTNIKEERGLNYPFQRSVSVNMNITF